MRQKLWLRFHIWTLGLLALLTVANIATALRPFSTRPEARGSGVIRLTESTASIGRDPASESSSRDSDPKIALKLAQVGCEPVQRLRVLDGIRQVRLLFDTCDTHDNDAIKSIANQTNGFEATVFGSDRTASFAGGAFEEKEHAGTFVAFNAKKIRAEKDSGKSTAVRSIASSQISTDYISLAPGENKIKIQREGREQTLLIQRK